MSNKLFVWIPFIALVALIGLFWKGLYLDTNKVPSPLIDKKAPELVLPDLLDATSMVNLNDWLGEVVLLNVWATWCSGCLQEHSVLNAIAASKQVPIIGLNWKDNPDKAKKWLHTQGNPFVAIPNDLAGQVAINWGVYGAPETFIVDKHGMIRYKHIAPITEHDVQTVIMPIVHKLQAEN